MIYRDTYKITWITWQNTPKLLIYIYFHVTILGGTLLTVLGYGFAISARVIIGGVLCPKVEPNSPHEITCRTPPLVRTFEMLKFAS